MNFKRCKNNLDFENCGAKTRCKVCPRGKNDR